MLTIEDKIKGAFFGVAIGDALGAPLEFMNKKEIQHKYGTVKNMIGGGWLNVDPGEITDDTQMTLAVAKGIIECPDAPEPYVGKYFIDWLKTNPKDVGRTCRVSINNVIQTIKNSSECLVRKLHTCSGCSYTFLIFVIKRGFTALYFFSFVFSYFF